MNLELLTENYYWYCVQFIKGWYYGTKKINPKIDLTHAVLNCTIRF